jgi:hypothetical protein
VLAAYFIVGTLPIGMCLYGLNVARRGGRWIGYTLFVMSALSLVLLLVVAARGQHPSWRILSLLSILVGIGVLRMETGPFKRAIAKGATSARWWPPIVPVLLLIVLMALVSPADKVVFGPKEEIYYENGATEADARRLGSALQSLQFFDGHSSASVLVTRTPAGLAVCFVAGEGVWNDPEALAYFQELRRQLTTRPHAYVPLEVRLCDSSGRTKRVIGPPDGT